MARKAAGKGRFTRCWRDDPMPCSFGRPIPWSIAEPVQGNETKIS